MVSTKKHCAKAVRVYRVNVKGLELLCSFLTKLFLRFEHCLPTFSETLRKQTMSSRKKPPALSIEASASSPALEESKVAKLKQSLDAAQKSVNDTLSTPNVFVLWKAVDVFAFVCKDGFISSVDSLQATDLKRVRPSEHESQREAKHQPDSQNKREKRVWKPQRKVFVFVSFCASDSPLRHCCGSAHPFLCVIYQASQLSTYDSALIRGVQDSVHRVRVAAPLLRVLSDAGRLRSQAHAAGYDHSGASFWHVD